MRPKKTLIAAVALIFTGMIAGAVLTSRLEVTPNANSSKIAEAGISSDPSPLWGKTFVGITKKVLPSVVTIYSNKKVKAMNPNYRRFPDQFDEYYDFPFRFFFQPKPNQENEDFVQSGLGSGVIVSSDGYILTNNHVVADVDLIQIQLQDGKKYKAEIVGKDEKSDLAVLKIDANDLPAASLGNSDTLEVGELVLAMGSPLGFSQTVTMGIVSATDRYELVLPNQPYADFIQTDAAINPGNSGGALVNTKGEVVGINTAIASRDGYYQGYGFAIPSNMAKLIMESLIKTGKVVRGFIGIGIQNIDDTLSKALNLKSASGVLINQVYEDMPGEKAGLKPNDIIIELNGDKIENVNALQRKVFSTPPGEKIRLTIIRDDREKNINVVLTELENETDDSKESDTVNKTLGLEVTELTERIARELGLNEDDKGVVISKVESLSPAYNAGLRRGDLIIDINRKKITSIKDYAKATKDLEKGDILLVRYKRGEVYLSVGVVID